MQLLKVKATKSIANLSNHEADKLDLLAIFIIS